MSPVLGRVSGDELPLTPEVTGHRGCWQASLDSLTFRVNLSATMWEGEVPTPMKREIGQWYADTTKGLALPSQAKGSPREATILDTTLL